MIHTPPVGKSLIGIPSHLFFPLQLLGPLPPFLIKHSPSSEVWVYLEVFTDDLTNKIMLNIYLTTVAT